MQSSPLNNQEHMMTWVTINFGAGASFIISLRLKPFMVKTTNYPNPKIESDAQSTTGHQQHAIKC